VPPSECVPRDDNLHHLFVQPFPPLLRGNLPPVPLIITNGLARNNVAVAPLVAVVLLLLSRKPGAMPYIFTNLKNAS